MPRKVNYALDYDYDYDYDDYQDYQDYDDHENNNGGDANADDIKNIGNNNHGNKGKLSQPDKTVSKPNLWQCSICTYDNDESSLHCDICGVLREPYINSKSAPEEKGSFSDAEIFK